MIEGYSGVSKNKMEGYYYVDSNGGCLNEQKYEECETFDEGIARVKYKDDRGWGLLSKFNGDIIDGFDRINDFSGTTNLHITGILNGKAAMIVIDSLDSKVVETKTFEYRDISTAYYDCFSIVQDNEEHYGVIDILTSDDLFSKKEVIPTSYD